MTTMMLPAKTSSYNGTSSPASSSVGSLADTIYDGLLFKVSNPPPPVDCADSVSAPGYH